MNNLPSIELDYKKEFNDESSLNSFIPLNDIRKKKMYNSNSSVDKVLAGRLGAGDRSAFSIIFSTYYSDLVVFASRYTHDYNNAEEIVQDTFAKLWEDHKSINVKKSLKSFLLKSVQNRCIDWFRHNKIKQDYYKFTEENSISYNRDTENYILYSELHKEVENAIKMLPDQVSEAFLMNRYKGLKYHEIADILNVSVRTVEVRIGKALSFLRNYLKDYLIILTGTICLLM